MVNLLHGHKLVDVVIYRALFEFKMKLEESQRKNEWITGENHNKHLFQPKTLEKYRIRDTRKFQRIILYLFLSNNYSLDEEISHRHFQ